MGGARFGAEERGALPLQWPLVGRDLELELFDATLADPFAHGFVIHGAAGVGKTRLADQCLTHAAGHGRQVVRVTATEGARQMPLGALAHLLPPGLGEERCDLVAIVSQLRPVLTAQSAGDGPLVLFVDDLHLLDATSATVVTQLIDADLLFLVATVRTGEPMPPTLEALWHRARVRRVDLDELDRPAVERLLAAVLRGPVETATVAEICAASQGNALFIRELVLGALDAGQLSEQHGVWRLGGPLVATERLQELVAARLAGLEAAADLLDMLAVWEPVGLSTLEAAHSRDELERLDRCGVITVRANGRRQRVSLAHPLYGEVLRERMSALTRRRLLTELADRLEAAGAKRREDAIRIAAARLEAQGAADPDLLIRAARLARYALDFPQVERFARAAVVERMTPESGLLLGEALTNAAQYDEAEAVLSAAETAARDDDPLLVHIVEMRTRNLMLGELDVDAARTFNNVVRDRLLATNRAGAIELTINEGLLLAYAGRPREAIGVLGSVPALTMPRSRSLLALSEVPALIALGKCDTALERARAAYDEQSQLPEQIAIPHVGVHVIMQIYALAESGRFDESNELATAAYEGSAGSESDGPAWLAFHLGRSALRLGRPETARRWLAEATARSEQRRIRSARRLSLSALATACALLGDSDAADAAVASMDALAEHPYARAEQEQGRAWALVARGELSSARDVLRQAADMARRSGFLVTEALMLHDVARLGEPGTIVDRLAELAAECEGPLVQAYAAHAGAAAQARPDGLVDATDRFQRVGAQLLAAEAATEAAQAFQNAGDRRSSAALGARAASLLESCEGARTPALTVPVMVTPLTARERDVATLAARGVPSKEIAERLFLSVRTVNNHLQSVYTKLGVSGRRELAAALAGEAGADT